MLTPSILEARGISKSFGPVSAVNSVSLNLHVGEVLGLVGENGAGKSTLLSLLSGTLSPDEGEIFYKGEPARLASYHEATKSGIFRIFQHQALVPNLSVAANVYLAQEKLFSRFGVLDSNKMVKQTQSIFDELNIESIHPRETLGHLKFAQRQVVEIVRSLAQARLLGIEHPIILHDEPTSALSREQIDFFFQFVNRIKDQAAQVFVSHRLQEIIQLCDRMVVLKDGVVVSRNDDPRALSEKQIHELMVGREVSVHQRVPIASKSAAKAKPILELKRLSAGGFQDVSLQVMPGEIVGIAGVVGSGKSDLGRVVFELGAKASGELLVRGSKPRRQGPRASIRSGIGYVPTERHAEGIIEVMSVARNLSLPEIGAAIGSVVLNEKREQLNAVAAIKELNIKAHSPDTPIRELSGGNQQKVLLARWISLKSQLLILDNPTNGVDVGAKVEIYRIIEQLTQDGVAAILISDDLPELISMSDRIIVMKDGRIKLEMVVDPDNPPSELDLVAYMV